LRVVGGIIKETNEWNEWMNEWRKEGRKREGEGRNLSRILKWKRWQPYCMELSSGKCNMHFISPLSSQIKRSNYKKTVHTQYNERIQNTRFQKRWKMKKHYRTKLLIKPSITTVNTSLSNSLSMNFLRRLSITLHNDKRPREFLKNTMSSPSFTPKIIYTALLMQLSCIRILVADRGGASDAYNTKEDNMISLAEQWQVLN